MTNDEALRAYLGVPGTRSVHPNAGHVNGLQRVAQAATAPLQAEITELREKLADAERELTEWRRQR